MVARLHPNSGSWVFFRFLAFGFTLIHVCYKRLPYVLYLVVTLPKFNIALEKGPFQEESCFPILIFRAYVKFRGCNSIEKQLKGGNSRGVILGMDTLHGFVAS